jgi:DNA-binding beta-propeller fold protein YncE
MDTNANPRTTASPGRRTVPVLTALALVGLGLTAAPAQAGSQPSPVGAVYVATNSYAGNAVLTFPRLADGSLLPSLPPVSTQGLGSGPGQIPGVATDPLGSQGSLIVSAKEQRLYVVNAGSNSVTALRIKGQTLTVVGRSSSGGEFPVSLAVSGESLFVLNAQSNSVSRLLITSAGGLVLRQTCALPAPPRPLDPPYLAGTDHSAQPFGTEAPGQVGVSPDGKHVVVIAKEGPVWTGFPFGETAGNGSIHVFDTDATGAMTNCTSGPTTYTLPENATNHGKFPFSFAWSARGQLLVTEVFGTGASATASAVQPFTLNSNGSLTPISDPVGTNQVVVCWIVVTGDRAFTANYLANDVSSLAIGRDGSVTTIQGSASGSAPLVTPIDLALSPSGKYLYQLSPGNGTVVPFTVDAIGGTVTALAPAGLGANSAGAGHQGIATFDYPK